MKKIKMRISDILYFLQGTVRYKLYYSKLRFLIRGYIFDQISWRIMVMDSECLNKGFCKKCGCKTTALQMCDKSCEGNCYPKMLNEIQWEHFKSFTDNTVFLFNTKYIDSIIIKKYIFRKIALKENFINAKTSSFKDRTIRYEIMKNLYTEYNEQ